MTHNETDSRTPGRTATSRSTLAGQDLLRRLRRLPLPPESLPRVARFVEEEVEAALEAARKASFSADEIGAAGGDAELLAKLEKKRTEAERVQALKKSGLAGLDKDEVEKVLELARRK